MAPKKKGKKKKNEPPPDPYVGFIRLTLSLDKPGAALSFPLLLYQPALTVGDIFKELWRLTELNEEWDDEGEDEEDLEVNKFVLYGPIVGVGKGQQVILTYALDKDLTVEGDLRIKSGDTIIYSSLNKISFDKAMKMRPSQGWKKLLLDSA